MIDIKRLDYPKIAISMRVTNQHEASFRLHAVAKEPWTAAFIEAIPEDAPFYDVGANVGSYTLLALALGHPVVALEPSASSFAGLITNAALNNHLDRLIPFQIALGETTRLDWLHYRDIQSGAASHHLGGMAPGDKPIFFHRQVVQVWRLDDLIATFKLPEPAYLKIDVDGTEREVLAGADAALSYAQGIMLEMKTDQEADLTKHLAERGLPMVGRFDRRNGELIKGVAYGHFRRDG